MTLVRVVSAAQAAARDTRAIEAGVPSRALMQAAGHAAVAEIQRAAGGRLQAGVDVYAGGGNNGGDAWVVATALAAAGVPVRVHEVEAPRTPDAIAEKADASMVLQRVAPPRGRPGVVVDGVLGTGGRGAPRGVIAQACADIAAARRDGAFVVALDVPSGLEASTGAAEGAPSADLTVTFGTIKRGQLVARQLCGTIVAVDIGLGAHAGIDDGAAVLADAAWVRAAVPRIAADAHKGARRKVAIVGGARGMAGAAVLAARAAVRSGVGLVKLVVAGGNLDIVQGAVPEALAAEWPTSDADAADIVAWADALLVGPGLGRGAESRALVERMLRGHRKPVVLDADALNVFEHDAASLAALLAGRPALLTPHPAEFARLAGCTTDDVLARRYDIAGELAATLGATVLLKGVPTIVSASDGRSVVSASGTPVLAQGGSGDVLGGIAATLLAQTDDALRAGAAAAWIHGRAAELASPLGDVRGVTLEDVLAALREAWRCDVASHAPHVLAELRAVGER